MRNYLSAFLIASLLLLSCSKSEVPGNTNTLSNMTVSATASTDNSGNVAFVVSATNAVSFEFDFGNGIFLNSTGGVLTYKYPASGTYTVNVIAKNSSGQTLAKSTTVTVTVAMSLVWSDEFDTNGAPNPAKWGYDVGTGSGGWGNNELQYYTSRTDNAIVSNGILQIIAKKELFGGSNYTSARLLSKDKFSFKYGKVEVRAKLPAGIGTWPAIWMLGSNISNVGWPACGEIDIMEHKGSELNKIHGSLHHPGHSGGSADTKTVTISNATTDFHRYTVEWKDASIKFLIDDVLFYTFANSSTLPFNQPFFLLLNVAMGGTFGGSVDPAFSNASMEIDYVRVYQ